MKDYAGNQFLVLVIEEKQEILQQVTSALAAGNYSSCCSTTAEGALAAAEENPARSDHLRHKFERRERAGTLRANKATPRPGNGAGDVSVRRANSGYNPPSRSDGRKLLSAQTVRSGRAVGTGG